MTSKQFLGIGHYSRTGKDSLANAIVAELAKLGIKAAKSPFAWKLKQITHDLYAWDGMREPEFYDTKGGEAFRDIPLPTIGKTPVQIWVDLGTPAVRDCVYDRTWIDYNLKADHGGAEVVSIPDCRFRNEVDAVRLAGGKLIKVVRPGYGPRLTVADMELVGYDGWDYIVGASGEMSELYCWAETFALALAGHAPWPVQTEDEKAEARSVEVLPKLAA